MKKITIPFVIALQAMIFTSSVTASHHKAGEHDDFSLKGGKRIARYMNDFDRSSNEKITETYKPYLRVYASDGETRLTKDDVGKYTHHRGIYIGWKTIKFQGGEYDLWHMNNGSHQVHKEFINKKKSSFTSLVHWNIGKDDVKTIIEEERTFSFKPLTGKAYALIDFKSTLTAAIDDLELTGDREHAGIQFRPRDIDDGLDSLKTVYFFPGGFEAGDKKKKTVGTMDLPWMGETVVIDGKSYTIVILNHPDNPKESQISAYRDYGRFGYFPQAKIKKGESFTVQYRYMIAEGVVHDGKYIQYLYNRYAGTNDAVPEVVVQDAQRKSKKKKKK